MSAASGASALPAVGVAAHQELATLAREDQADRKRQAVEVAANDARRRARVKQLLDADEARLPDDFFNAALVFQHGTSVADIQLAHRLAVTAAELDPTEKAEAARWLAAASKDRELMMLGKPQLYGTQLRTDGGIWSVYPVDPTVTDAERARWGVPPLNEAVQRAAAKNAPR